MTSFDLEYHAEWLDIYILYTIYTPSKQYDMLFWGYSAAGKSGARFCPADSPHGTQMDDTLPQRVETIFLYLGKATATAWEDLRGITSFSHGQSVLNQSSH